MIGKVIHSLILNGATDAGQSIYPDVLPQSMGENSTIVRYATISTIPNRTYQAQDNRYQSLIQIDCFAKKKSEVETLASQIRDIMEGYKGTVLGIRTEILISDAGRSYYDDEFEQFNINMDIRCWWQKS